MKKLRLIIFEDCNRACPGCCNKDWDIQALPICDLKDLVYYDEVMITGGEPMLDPDLVMKVMFKCRPDTKVILYTAKVDEPEKLIHFMDHLSGVTLTLHDQDDVEPFIEFSKKLFASHVNVSQISLRLNVFKGIEFPIYSSTILNRWAIKSDMEWIKDCPLPNEEVLMRLA
jgi:organic radical activating enzyme